MTNRHESARNRAAAQLAGDRTFTGTPCRAAGHPGTRYTSTGACVECMGDRYKATRAAPEPVAPQRGPLSQLAVEFIL